MDERFTFQSATVPLLQSINCIRPILDHILLFSYCFSGARKFTIIAPKENLPTTDPTIFRFSSQPSATLFPLSILTQGQTLQRPLRIPSTLWPRPPHFLEFICHAKHFNPTTHLLCVGTGMWLEQTNQDCAAGFHVNWDPRSHRSL